MLSICTQPSGISYPIKPSVGALEHTHLQISQLMNCQVISARFPPQGQCLILLKKLKEIARAQRSTIICTFCTVQKKKVSVKTSVRTVDFFKSATEGSLYGISKFTPLYKEINTVLRLNTPFFVEAASSDSHRVYIIQRHPQKMVRFCLTDINLFITHRTQVYKGGMYSLDILYVRVLQITLDISQVHIKW